jgi:predicted transcriptional regulator
MSDIEKKLSLVTLTAEIASAYVENHNVAADELPAIIRGIHAALSGAGPVVEAALPEPAVPVRKSITDDYLICLEDGKKFKSLRRHLRARYNMSPEQYRAKWALPISYPMVAPGYAARRSTLAKAMGLGSPKSESHQRKKAS